MIVDNKEYDIIDEIENKKEIDVLVLKVDEIEEELLKENENFVSLFILFILFLLVVSVLFN